jgi:hypothetical protein
MTQKISSGQVFQAGHFLLRLRHALPKLRRFTFTSPKSDRVRFIAERGATE